MSLNSNFLKCMLLPHNHHLRSSTKQSKTPPGFHHHSDRLQSKKILTISKNSNHSSKTGRQHLNIVAFLNSFLSCSQHQFLPWWLLHSSIMPSLLARIMASQLKTMHFHGQNLSSTLGHFDGLLQPQPVTPCR